MSWLWPLLTVPISPRTSDETKCLYIYNNKAVQIPITRPIFPFDLDQELPRWLHPPLPRLSKIPLTKSATTGSAHVFAGDTTSSTNFSISCRQLQRPIPSTAPSRASQDLHPTHTQIRRCVLHMHVSSHPYTTTPHHHVLSIVSSSPPCIFAVVALSLVAISLQHPLPHAFLQLINAPRCW
jgi:hypothetical protein